MKCLLYCYTVKNVKSFPSHKAQPETSLHCQIMDAGLVHLAVCLFMSQLSLVLIASIHEGMARLSCATAVKTVGAVKCKTTTVDAVLKALNSISILRRSSHPSLTRCHMNVSVSKSSQDVFCVSV